MDSVTVTGPPAFYPAERRTRLEHIIRGVECFTIDEYRGDGLILTLRRCHPCLMVGSLGERLIWASVEAEFLEFWVNLHHWDLDHG